MRMTSVRVVDVPAEFWTGHLPNTSRKLYGFGRRLSVWHLFIFVAGWSRQAEWPDIGRNFRSAIVVVHEIGLEWGSVLPNQQETIDKSCHIWVHMNVTSTWLQNLMRCPHTDIPLAALARGFCKPTRLVFTCQPSMEWTAQNGFIFLFICGLLLNDTVISRRLSLEYLDKLTTAWDGCGRNRS